MVDNEKVDRAQTTANKLAHLVRYQEGSTVSRTIIQKKAGTVTLFAFDQKQELSEHTAPFEALVLILEGEAKITFSGKTHHLKEGEMVIIPADHPHALQAVTKFKMLLIMVRSC